MHRKHRPFRATLILTLAGILTSCAETPENLSAPPDNTGRPQLQAFQVHPQPGVHLSGQIKSSIWQSRGEGFAYLGTMSAPVEGTLAPLADENATSRIIGPPRFTELPDVVGSSSSKNTPLLAGSNGKALWNVLNASGPGKALRVKLGGPVYTDTMPDGRELRVEFNASTGGRPATAMAFYVDHELVALNFLTHRRQGSRWTTAAMNSVHFAETGGVALITNHDLTGIEADPVAITQGAVGAAVGGVQSLSSDCETQIIPDPSCEEEACWEEWLNFASASAAWLAASAAFGTAVAGCPTTGALCAAAFVALAAMNEASILLEERADELEDCRRRNSAGGGSGERPGGGGTNCATYIIEVSNDGGNTWTEIGRVRICD